MYSNSCFPTLPKVLVVDDDDATREAFGCALEGAGYQVITANDGGDAISLVETQLPDLVLLDVSMPIVNGWRAIEMIRQRGYTGPVIMLTGLSQVEDRVRGLSCGADDYLCKPVDFRELLARVHAMLRRARPSVPSTFLRFGATTVDLPNRAATRDGAPVELTRTEFALLDFFAQHEGKLVTRDQMLAAVWGYTRQSNTRTVDTHIWRLRQKLGEMPGQARWITSVPAGDGYRMVTDQALATASVATSSTGRCQVAQS